MTCIIRKQQKDEVAKIRLAFNCTYAPLGSVPSVRELPKLLDRTQYHQFLERCCLPLSPGLATLLFCNQHFKVRLV